MQEFCLFGVVVPEVVWFKLVAELGDMLGVLDELVEDGREGSGCGVTGTS